MAGERRHRWLAAGLVLAFLLVVMWSQGRAPPVSDPRAGDAGGTAPVPARAREPIALNATAAPAVDAGPRPRTCSRERHAQYRRLRQTIDPAASAEAAIEHALLSRMLARDDPAESAYARRSLQSALRRWPGDVELAWLGLRACDGRPDCDASSAEAHVLRTDPDNATAWMLAMQRARSERDPGAYARAVHRAANAKFYDSRMGTVFARLRPLLERLPVPASCMADVGALRDVSGRMPTARDHADMEASAYEAAIAVPSFQALAGCGPGAGDGIPQAMREDCRALLTQVAASDTLLEQDLAVALLIALTPDPARNASLRERYRQLQWLRTHIAETDGIEGFAWRRWTEGEAALLQAHLAAQGRWPPPPDWLPDDARARGLVLGGPVPSRIRN